MKRRKVLNIGIDSGTRQIEEFIAAWKLVEGGKTSAEPRHALYFSSLELLLKTLSTRRLQLLQTLRQVGPTSIRALSIAVGRDYKNVHTDIKELTALEIVLMDDDKKVRVDWDVLNFEIPLLKTAG